MSKIAQQSQGGSGKPNFKSYKNGSSGKGAARRKERADKEWAANMRKKERRQQF